MAKYSRRRKSGRWKARSEKRILPAFNSKETAAVYRVANRPPIWRTADANALPKNFGDYMQSAVGDMNSFVPISRQKEMLKIALERELALVISSMHGIEAAEVLYDRQTDTGLNQKETVTATVTVRTSGNEPLPSAQAQTIRRVVAGAISNLSPKSVVVADQFGISASGGGDDSSVASGYEDAYGANKRMYEQEWYDKIREALDLSQVLMSL